MIKLWAFLNFDYVWVVLISLFCNDIYCEYVHMNRFCYPFKKRTIHTRYAIGNTKILSLHKYGVNYYISVFFQECHSFFYFELPESELCHVDTFCSI